MRIARDISFARAVLALSLLLLATTKQSTAQAAPQTSAPTTAPPAPGIELDPLTEYPSMIPVLEIRINLSEDYIAQSPTHDPYAIKQVILDAVKTGQGRTPWDCSQKSSYDVENNTTKRRLEVASIRLEGAPTCTNAGIGTVLPAIVLVLRPGSVALNDKLQVSLSNLPSPVTASSSAIVSRSDAVFKNLKSSSVALTIAPQAAPGEALTTGVKRDVGQLAIAFTNPTVASVFHRANLFVSSTDLFSTDERDSKSAFAATVGVQRGLSSSWYIPASIQETLQGNQVATNFSAVTAGTAGFLVPWRWTGKTFDNTYIVQTSAYPEVTLNANYTHRINQLVTKATPLLATDDFSFNPYATYAPIYLFPHLCTSLQNHLAKNDKTKTAATSKQYCLGLQLDGGMYYLPLDLNKSGSRRAEGDGDMSILVPLSDIPFVTSAVTNLITGSPTSAQIRIKYSDSVNASNNYARSRQWTFAIEGIK